MMVNTNRCPFSLPHASQHASTLLIGLAAWLSCMHAAANDVSGSIGLTANLLQTSDLTGTETITDGEELYLEVIVNLAPTGQIARFIRINGRFHANASTLQHLGLAWPGAKTSSPLVSLQDIPGLEVEYLPAQQRMRLTVPVRMLNRPPLHLGWDGMPETGQDRGMRAAGLLLNYDINAQADDTSRTLSGWGEARLFGLGAGMFSTRWNSRVTDISDNGRRREHIRLESYWRLDFPGQMLALSLGDNVTGTVPWSRPTRFGGLRLSRDFSLQPYRITAPLASFAGEATLPSTVDLFIDGIRQSSHQVPPGQFQIDSSPWLNGAGEAQLVVTDVSGIRHSINIPFYGTPRLLGAGLSDWSLDLGWVRQDFGLASFSYASRPMLSASLQHGLNNALTLETHAESTQGLCMAGAGGIWLPGVRTGMFNASIAGSRHEGRHGRQFGFGYQWSGNGFNLNASSLRRNQTFRDVASLSGSAAAQRTDQVFIGMSTSSGQWGGGYVYQQHTGNNHGRYTTLNWSRQIRGMHNVHVNLLHDQQNRRGNSASLSWSLMQDSRRQVAASLRNHADASTLALHAQQSLDADRGGWGWRMQGVTDTRGHHSMQAQVEQLQPYGRWNAGLANHDIGGTSGWANAQGALLWMAGQIRPMHRADSAFAMVSTDGIPGVPVRLENRLVGHTDHHGLLLVDRLQPWQRNKLSIDPLELPTEMHIATTRVHVIPAGPLGVLARFPMRRALSLQVGTLDTRDHPLPAGSPVWLSTDDMEQKPPITVIGHDGLLYLQDPPSHARLQVKMKAQTCQITLPDLADTHGFIALEGVVCQ